jgi:hypothetical protein
MNLSKAVNGMLEAPNTEVKYGESNEDERRCGTPMPERTFRSRNLALESVANKGEIGSTNQGERDHDTFGGVGEANSR